MLYYPMFQSLKLNLGTRKSEKGQMKKERAVALGLGFDAWNWQLISVTFGSAATKRYFWDLTGTLPKKKKKDPTAPMSHGRVLENNLKKKLFFSADPKEQTTTERIPWNHPISIWSRGIMGLILIFFFFSFSYIIFHFFFVFWTASL